MSMFGDNNKRLSPIDELKSPSVHCIREIYESDNAHNHFISELDRGLYEETEYIIIEPTKLGDETARWIKAGNCLHKTAVFSGLATIASSLIWPRQLTICGSFCFVSLSCIGLYTISWSTDPCVQYQVENNPKKLSKVPNLNDFSSPVVLVYSSNKKIKYLHRMVTALGVAFCAYRVYESFK